MVGRSCHTKWGGGVWRAGLAEHKLPVSQHQGSNTGQEALARPPIGNAKGAYKDSREPSYRIPWVPNRKLNGFKC